MTNELHTIHPGVGLGTVHFGMTRREVEAILGEPDEKETYPFSGDRNDGLTEVWHYDDRGLSASFDELEDWKLVILAVTSPDYKIGGKSLLGLEKSELIKELGRLDLGELEIEEWAEEESGVSTDHDMVWAYQAGVNFWLENGDVIEIEWSPVITFDGDMIWPGEEEE